MTSMSALPHANCPLCGQANDCAPARAGTLDVPCWCAAVQVQPEALARVSPAMLGQACLCHACATSPGTRPDAAATAAIRRLNEADVDAYRTVMLEAYEQHPDAFTSSAAERAALPLSWWRDRLGAQGDQHVFGAFDESVLIGVAGLRFERGDKVNHKATLFGMYVQPRGRQRGFATALVRAVLADAAQRPGVSVVQLTVSEGNAAAERLYACCGFVRFGVEPMAMRVGERYVGKVHMWCSLPGNPIDTGR